MLDAKAIFLPASIGEGSPEEHFECRWLSTHDHHTNNRQTTYNNA